LPLFGSPNVQKLIDKRDYRRLAGALADGDATTREQAEQGFVELRDAASVPFIVDVVTAHQRADVIDAGVHVLQEIGSDSVPPLVAGLRDAPPDKRAGYAAVLGRLGPRYGLQPLLETSRDSTPGMRAIAAMGLGLMDAPEARQRLAQIVASDESIEARGYAGFAMATNKVSDAYETLAWLASAPKRLAQQYLETTLGPSQEA
jgi:HEAT repeats